MGSNSHVACGWEAAGSWSEGAITDEPYERIVHVRVRGGRRGKLRPLPGSRRRASPRWAASAAAMNWAGCSTTIIGKPRELPFSRSAEFFGSTASRRWRLRLRYRGSRHWSGVAEFISALVASFMLRIEHFTTISIYDSTYFTGNAGVKKPRPLRLESCS